MVHENALEVAELPCGSVVALCCWSAWGPLEETTHGRKYSSEHMLGVAKAVKGRAFHRVC